jgi:hypothetical protein
MPDHTRVITVAADRLARWCDGFADRHGGESTVTRAGPALVLAAPDGATAALVPAFPLPETVQDLPRTIDWVAAARRCAVVLVRRGGYACALIDTGLTGAAAVTASKVGTRYVQGRTAAGGWSQQRFARRRDNQARDLVRAVADVAARLLVFGVPDCSADWLVTGGDRPLVDAVLADPRLRPLARLPRSAHLGVGDPKADVLRRLPDRLRAVQITLSDP